MIIGIVLPYLKSRGTEKQALRLAKGLGARGHKIVVFNIMGWGCEEITREFDLLGIPVISIGSSRHVGEKRIDLKRVFLLAAAARAQRCTAIISRSGLSNRITALAGLFVAIPVLVVFSSAVVKTRERGKGVVSWILSIIRRTKDGWPSAYVSVSSEGAERFRKSFPWLGKRVFSIPNGISEEEYNWDDDPYKSGESPFFDVCYTGSLELYRKGLDILVNALHILIHELGRTNIRIIIIGTGEDEQMLKSMVSSKSLQDFVHFAGEQNPPYELMKMCKIYVLPSRREGMPNALLEAMRLGLCCVAADCDTGPREIIVHDKSGVLVPVNDERALALGILRLMDDSKLRDDIACKGRQRVLDCFSSLAMVLAYETVLITLINKDTKE